MTWKEISVKKYVKISELGDIDLEDLGVLMELISIIWDLTWNEVENLPINEAAKKKAEIIELFSNELDQNYYEKEFTIDSFKFEFPDLQNDWIFAKNVDLNNLAGDFKNFPICLAIIYYPKDIKYETTTAMKLAKLIEDKPISSVYGSWWFFFLFSVESAKLTGNYSVLDLMTEMTKLLMKGAQNPEKLLPLLKAIMLRKLRKSGISSEHYKRFQAEE